MSKKKRVDRPPWQCVYMYLYYLRNFLFYSKQDVVFRNYEYRVIYLSAFYTERLKSIITY